MYIYIYVAATATTLVASLPSTSGVSNPQTNNKRLAVLRPLNPLGHPSILEPNHVWSGKLMQHSKVLWFECGACICSNHIYIYIYICVCVCVTLRFQEFVSYSVRRVLPTHGWWEPDDTGKEEIWWWWWWWVVGGCYPTMQS